MKREMIMLKTINDVKAFVNSVVKCDFDVDLTSGRYTVDAKSIMGIFSLGSFQASYHGDSFGRLRRLFERNQTFSSALNTAQCQCEGGYRWLNTGIFSI